MLTTVYLHGAMGKKFGKQWELSIKSPREALSLIDANVPGLIGWIRSQLAKYSSYRVVCEYEDGRREDMDNDTYLLDRKLKSVRFIPIIEGAGDGLKVVLGIALIAAFGVTGNVLFLKVGASLLLSGLIGMLSPQPKSRRDNGDSATSNYFDGPQNTTQQGVPVQLIYGKRIRVGSQLISARLSVE